MIKLERAPGADYSVFVLESTGDAVLIRESDGKAAGMIYTPYVEAVSQALGIGIPVRKAEVE